MRPLVDDPVWVRERYEEAKEIIADLREEGSLMAAIAPDISGRVEQFYCETFLDRCTTLGPDCGCNTPARVLEPREASQ